LGVYISKERGTDILTVKCWKGIHLGQKKQHLEECRLQIVTKLVIS